PPASIYLANQGQQPQRLLGMREARSNNGYLGQDDPVLHFGLGEYEFGFARVAFMGQETVAQVIFGPSGTEPIL
ncbi:MAG: ASPIC/UnbV domain-containing protein, partial [Pirellulales bacterium]